MNPFSRLLPGLLIATAFSVASQAQVVTPQPAPTIITTAPYTINKPGYYQLGADLVYTGTAASAIITINASNVTLDFGGHYISGRSSNTTGLIYGVYANEQGNLLVRNGTVAFCYVGVYLNGNGGASSLNINQHVDNMLVTHCFGFGVDFYNVSTGDVTNCRLSAIGGSPASQTSVIAALYLYGSGLRALNNTINGVVSTDPKNTGAYGVFQGNVVSGNAINGISAPDDAVGVYQSVVVTGNNISTITRTSNFGYSIGIYDASIAIGNTVIGAAFGVYGDVNASNANKYKDNVTYNCPTPFYGGTDVEGNN